MKVKPFIIFVIMFISVIFLVGLITCGVISWVDASNKQKRIEVAKQELVDTINDVIKTNVIIKSLIKSLKSINSTYNIRFIDGLNDYYITCENGFNDYYVTCEKYEKNLAHVKNRNEIIYETNDAADINLLKEFAEMHKLKVFNSVKDYEQEQEKIKQEQEKADKKETKIQAIIIIFLTLLLYGFVIYKVW